MKSISIITNKRVDKTFKGVECLLRRTITKFSKINGIRRYTILTDRCNYDMENNLISLGIKDSETIKIVDSIESDLLFNLIKEKVSLVDSYSDFVHNIELESLLLGTQMDKPYGTLPEDWIKL